MNKQDEEKAKEIIESSGYITYFGGNKEYTKDICLHCALEMAEWKEQQMIEKSRIWFESVLPEILLNHEPTGVSGIFENFKKAMEE